MKHLSACNGFSNALAMAKMGQIMTFGVVDGKQFLKPETIQKALEPLAKEKDVYLFKSVVRTKGGFVLHEIVANGKKHDVYGWSGMGGSLFMFDPKEKFSFGYVPAVQGGQFVELDVRSKELLTKFYEK
jgi:CubicO group peptidase (beta-lactamase class C family)